MTKEPDIEQPMHQEASLAQIVPSLDLDNNEDISVFDMDVCQDIQVNPTAQATLSSACSEDSGGSNIRKTQSAVKKLYFNKYRERSHTDWGMQI